MGYDMYWVEPASEEELVSCRAARGRWEAAVAACDAKFGPLPFGADTDAVRASPEHAAVERACREMEAADPSYFRLNIWGMAVCRDLMFERGMLDVEAIPPDVASFNQFGLDAAPEERDPGAYEPESPEARFLTACLAALRHDAGGPIPAYKLGSNSRWLVTPAEILRSLEAFVRSGAEQEVSFQGRGKPNNSEYTAMRLFGQVHHGMDAAPERVAWWPHWIAFLVGASKHGGFLVT